MFVVPIADPTRSRVDLRDPTDPEQGDATAESAERNASLATNPDNTTSPEISTTQRGHRNGLSLYLHHTLNTRRMRDATPEERIAALRRLRTANRASARQSVGEANGDETARNRLSLRFRDAFRIGARPVQGVDATNERPMPTPVDAGPAEREEEEEEEEHRGGTFAE